MIPADRDRPAAPSGIARRPDGPSALDFDALRAEGIALVQAYSGQLWTDFNLHDPGVTLLEALCFALTEGVYEAGHAVPSLLGGPDGVLDLPRHGLQPGTESLPSRPVTGADYQRWILDQVDGLFQLGMEPLPAAASRPPLLWRMHTQSADAGGPGGDDNADAAVAAYLCRRNLGEDLESRPVPLKAKDCLLRLQLSVAGPRDASDIVADLLQRCSDLVARKIPRTPMLEYLGAGLGRDAGLAELLEGPPNQRGFIESDRLAGSEDALCYFGDLAEALKSVEGVDEIRSLSLQADGLDSGGAGLPFKGPDWALRLRWPAKPEELRLITLTRAGAPVGLHTESLLKRLAELSGPADSPRSRAEKLPPVAASPPALPQGQELSDAPYYPALNHLPPAYLGASPFEVGAEGGRTKTDALPGFRGYLALFEQWMAHAQAQGRHLGDLFSADGGPQRSYWWQMLDEGQVPGMRALYDRPPQGVQAAVFEPIDEALERRGRILDFLLALHGVTFNQDRVRPFGFYHPQDAWNLQLFEQKRLLLARIVPFTRDRMGAFDYSRPSLDSPDNTPILQQWVGLELGFKHLNSRGLCNAFQESGLKFSRGEHASRLRGPGGPRDGWRPVVFSGHEDAPRVELSLAHLVQSLAPMRGGSVPEPFWRCAVHAGRYWLAPHGQGLRLMLGPDEDGHWWLLEERATAEKASSQFLHALALNLRSLAAGMQQDNEGMHLVEHVLLRPVHAPAPEPGEVPQDFYAARLTVIFPAWTSRCADESFRNLAQDALERHAPAHLEVRCLWLDFDAMRDFEIRWRSWLGAKRAQCAQPASAQAAAALDLFSKSLRVWLAARLEAGPEPRRAGEGA